MSLYQILAIDERLQSIALNVWVIEKWHDEFLGWDPNQYELINTTILPHQTIWLPDTYVYNSIVLSHEETERYINAVVTTKYWEGKRGAEVMFMCILHFTELHVDWISAFSLTTSKIAHW
uniref:Acetylcholine receptor subunit alpha-type deg-3 n=1 Tax=Ascaris suum TaxID=6253 RepID=F1LFC0_ASCSU